MARKGDILSKPVATRIPMEVYLRFQLMAFHKKQTISAFLCDYLSNEDRASSEGEIKEKIVYRDKVEYRDKIVYKEGGQALDKSREKIEQLEYSIERLEAENKKLFDANYDMECRLNKYDPEIIRARSKKEREEFAKKHREKEKKERANRPYHDKDGNVKYYDKDGNE
jgi:hypothetical protein